MVRHQAIPVKAKRISQLRLPQGVQEGEEVVFVVEDDLAVVATVESVLDHVGIDWPR